MFCEARDKALNEVKRVLKAGGRLYIAVLKEFGLMPLVGAGMEAVLGFQAPPPPTNPLALRAPFAVENLLGAAGLNVMVTETLVYDFPIGTPEGARRLALLPVMEKLAALEKEGKVGAAETYQNAFMAALEAKGWLSKATGEYVVPGINAQLVVATKAHEDVYHRTI